MTYISKQLRTLGKNKKNFKQRTCLCYLCMHRMKPMAKTSGFEFIFILSANCSSGGYGVVGCGKDVMYLTSPGCPTDIQYYWLTVGQGLLSL